VYSRDTGRGNSSEGGGLYLRYQTLMARARQAKVWLQGYLGEYRGTIVVVTHEEETPLPSLHGARSTG
jgi:hypothetical protein